MRAVLQSLLMGTLVGVAYAACNVRSPAPPIVALLGLLGMVVGEQACIIVKTRWPVSDSVIVETRTPTIRDR